MSSQPAERMTSRYRPALAIGIVVLSIVLPVALACWAVLSEMRDKGIADVPSKRVRYHYGSVKNRELWHAELQLSSNVSAPPIESRILRLDLETGVERDTGLVVNGEAGWPMWMGDSLFVVSRSAVFRCEENSLVKVAALPPPSPWFHASTFLWEDRLTTISQTDDGGFHLVHLSDKGWIPGRAILLPTSGRVWYDDQQRGRRVLLPLTSQQPASKTTVAAFLQVAVVQHERQHHLMIMDYNNQFSAYRAGFEFINEPQEGVSALAAENVTREVSGWEPIGPTPPDPKGRWGGMAASRDGLLFHGWDGQAKVARRRNDGTWESFVVPTGSHPVSQVYGVGSHDIGDPTDDTAYVIEADQTWGSACVRRIEGNTVHSAHLVLPGCEREYVARWKCLGVNLLCAWCLHVALLAGGAMWLARGAARATFEFGNQRATLAPLWRRAVAVGVDVALLFTVIVLIGRCFGIGAEIALPVGDETKLARALLDFEQSLYGAVVGAGGRVFMSPAPTLSYSIGWVTPRWSFRRSPDITLLLLSTLVVVVVCGNVFVEGRYGVTPGKWLLGLRTVRTTLRPCGFARALVRNVVYYVDLPLLLTPLPTAISLMFSDHRQRLGDRTADTLVIRARSICDAKSS
ncbi:MAG: RDD family protein [Candidatus Saccharimonas sp.]|nr:RDD family protein [Planctomycetaceae bacterium]